MYQYNHQHGTLHLPCHHLEDPTAVALSDIPAHNRQYPALSQVQMQAVLKQALESPTDSIDQPLQPVHLPRWEGETASSTYMKTIADSLDDWILNNLTDADVRKIYVRRLTLAARAFSYEKTEVLLAIGNLFSANVK